jgi:hypothetical protein
MSLFPSDERLRRIHYNGKEIFLVDYCGLKHDEMIELTNQHAEIVVSERKECFFIANYENTFASTDYMKAAYSFTQRTKLFIPRGAFLGISRPKEALLKGVVYFMQVNFRAFDTEADALDFLVS